MKESKGIRPIIKLIAIGGSAIVAVRDIIEIITADGCTSLDYMDLEITLKNDNAIMMGRGFGESKNRMEDAIANVLQSPLLHNNK